MTIGPATHSNNSNAHQMQVKPVNPIRRSRPSPQLAQALRIREQLRTPTMQEQCDSIRKRTHFLRAATYLLLLKYEESLSQAKDSLGPAVSTVNNPPTES